MSLASQAATGQACAVLDAAVFSHAAPSLRDARLLQGSKQIPYAITVSEPLQQDSDDARISNLRRRAGRIEFDLEMPPRPYSSLVLNLARHDFVATASLSAGEKPLGSYTLFDLSKERLSRDTSIPLQEASYRELHVDLAMTAAPGAMSTGGSLDDPALVQSVSVPPSREAQTIYTTIQQAAATQGGSLSVARFEVPAHVPVERVSVVLDQKFRGNFSRKISVTARALTESKTDASGSPGPVADGGGQLRDEAVAGTIDRVHLTEAGREISQEDLSVPLAIGSNMQREAIVEVAIDSGDSALPITAVRLEMRQRRLCFDLPTGSEPLRLLYGDSSLDAPDYEGAGLIEPDARPLAAELGPEVQNPEFVSAKKPHSLKRQRADAWWILVMAVFCGVAALVLRRLKRSRV